MKIVTHSGIFHADDVFAVATLLLKFPDAEVVRSRKKEDIESADIVVDVGLQYEPEKLKFDHHQHAGAGVRANGIPYASFGLVWKKFGEELCGGVEEARIIEEKLAMAIDAPDNGVSIYEPVFGDVRPYTIIDFLYSYILNGYTGEKYLYETFMKLMTVAKDLLEREIQKAQERVSGMKKVIEIVEDSQNKNIIVLEQDLPWEPILVPIPEAYYVVYLRREGNWGVKGVPVSTKSFIRKKLLPEAWAGKNGEELQSITGVKDAVFCHKDRFIAAAESKEGAMKLAEIALNA
ncbi:MYG1 family protein [Candidatus Parcubacteria bacterium]|nr:MYG1 family protein [Candidatus Parcubacteria bacterium]